MLSVLRLTPAKGSTSLKRVFEFSRSQVPATYVCEILIIVVRFFAVNDVIMMSSCQRQKHASIGIRIVCRSTLLLYRNGTH
jgi:hypothetical protein